MSIISIEFQHVGKQYHLGRVGTGTLSHDLNRFWQTRILHRDDPYLKIGETNDRTTIGKSDYVWALQDVSFSIQQGEVWGIIGRNGAGKSTLLKVLSNITSPTTGRISYNGRIASLLEVGTGFHPEMTGRENIYMNGAIMGMTRKEISSKLDEIVEFAGVERYLDTPVKRYSSGMTVRLGFSVAAFLEPEILVVDEVLAVGDAEFQKKALGKMHEVSNQQGRTVLFVSHNMGAIKNLCTKGLVLDSGKLSYLGTAHEAVSYYLKSSLSSQNKRSFSHSSSAPVYLSDLTVHDSGAVCCDTFSTMEEVLVQAQVHFSRQVTAHLLLTILDPNKVRLCSLDIDLKQREQVKIRIKSHFLARGHYSFTTHIYDPGLPPYDVQEDICPFTIVTAHPELSHLETFDYGTVYAQMEEI